MRAVVYNPDLIRAFSLAATHVFVGLMDVDRENYLAPREVKKVLLPPAWMKYVPVKIKPPSLGLHGVPYQ
jgi:hypothetical protein